MQPSSHRDHAGFRKWCLEAKSWSQAEFKQSSRRVQAGFSGFRFHSWLVATRLVLVESRGSAEMEKITLAGLNWKSVSPVSLSHVNDKNTKHDNKIARYDFRSDSLLISAANAFQARTLRADQCWGRSDLSTLLKANSKSSQVSSEYTQSHWRFATPNNPGPKEACAMLVWGRCMVCLKPQPLR